MNLMRLILIFEGQLVRLLADNPLFRRGVQHIHDRMKNPQDLLAKKNGEFPTNMTLEERHAEMARQKVEKEWKDKIAPDVKDSQPAMFGEFRKHFWQELQNQARNKK